MNYQKAIQALKSHSASNEMEEIISAIEAEFEEIITHHRDSAATADVEIARLELQLEQRAARIVSVVSKLDAAQVKLNAKDAEIKRLRKECVGHKTVSFGWKRDWDDLAELLVGIGSLLKTVDILILVEGSLKERLQLLIDSREMFRDELVSTRDAAQVKLNAKDAEIKRLRAALQEVEDIFNFADDLVGYSVEARAVKRICNAVLREKEGE